MKKKKIGEFPPAPDGRHQCKYCGRHWSTEKFLINHPCVYKLRWDQRDQRTNKSALLLYSRALGKTVSYEDFMYGTYFDAFMRVIRFIEDKNVPHPEKYIDFLQKQQIKLDDWASDAVYELYIRDYVEHENIDAALERNVLLMKQWAENTGNDLKDFFEHITPAQAIEYIKQGRLSPWIFYTLEARKKLFARMSDEQMFLVEKYAPFKKWKVKFSIKKQDVNNICEIFKLSGF